MSNQRPPYWEWPLDRLNVLILTGALLLLLGLSVVRFTTRERTPGMAVSPLPTSLSATATPLQSETTPTASAVDTKAPQILSPATSETFNQPLAQVEGSAPAGLRVALYDNQRFLNETTAGTDGHWTISLDPPLPEGDHLLWVQTLQPDGSPVSQSRNVMVSVLAAQPLTIDVPNASEPVQASRLQTISGRATAGGLVRLLLDDSALADTQADANGKWTYRLAQPLPLGHHQLSAALLSPGGDVLEQRAVLDLLLIP